MRLGDTARSEAFPVIDYTGSDLGRCTVAMGEPNLTYTISALFYSQKRERHFSSPHSYYLDSVLCSPWLRL